MFVMRISKPAYLLTIGIALFFAGGCLSTPEPRQNVALAYPLTECLVGGEDVDSEDSISIVHEGQEIKLCCQSCLGKFKANPSRYLSKLPNYGTEEAEGVSLKERLTTPFSRNKYTR